jgi:lipopolysaccharide heptosyltransferase II
VNQANPLALNRLLVVDLADIGDLIMTTPALSALRETYPAACIDLLTTAHAAPILNGTDLVNNVILFNKVAFDHPLDLLRPRNLIGGWQLARQLGQSQYDAVLIFRHLTTHFGALKHAALALVTGAPHRIGLDNGKGWFLTHRATDLGFGARHEVEYWLDVAALIGATTSNPRLRVGFSDADRKWAEDHLPPLEKLVVIHPGSGGYSLARRWEPEKFAQVADALHNEGKTIVLVGGPGDNAEEVIRHMQHPPINLVGQTTLNQLAAVISLASRYIGADSGVLHIAAAVGTPITSLYGPSNHLAWGPWHRHAATLRSDVLCSPCSYVGHTVGLRHGCEARTCMKLLTVQDVLDNRHDSPPRDEPLTPTLHVLGVPIHALPIHNLLDQFNTWITAERRIAHQICTVNAELALTAQKDVNCFNILKRADVCLPEGDGLRWAAQRLGHPLPDPVTGSVSAPVIVEHAAREGWRVFLLGSRENTAQALCDQYPGLQIVGTHLGTSAGSDEDEIVPRINASRADILFVAYPSPDKWIARNLPRLNVSVVMGIGEVFDVITGQLPPQNSFKQTLQQAIFMLHVLRRGSRGPVPFVGVLP